MIPYSRNTKRAAQELRKNMTPQEKHLWYDYLRTYPQQFRRQKQVDRFIVDFYCASARLVVEIDGSQHFTPEGIAYDAERTRILEQYGLRVIRFTNAQINEQFHGVCCEINRIVAERLDQNQ